jgi:hypothetical protein
MAQTSNLKLVSPDASSVLIPLHSHFAVLAGGVDQAITDRFQYKILAYETVADRDAVYTESTGLPVDVNSSKPALVDGDLCYIRQNKRYYIWNVNSTGTNSWTQTLKRFYFSSIANRDAYLAEDIMEGDTCYVTDVDINYTWNGSVWVLMSQQATVRNMDTGYTYQPQFSSAISTGTFTNGLTYAVPIFIPQTLTVSNIYFNLVTASTATASLTFAIYSNSTSGIDYPATKLVTSSAFTAGTGTATGAKTVAVTATVLQPGIYWLAMASNNGGGTDPTISRFSQSPYLPMSTTTSLAFLGNAAWSMSGTTPAATWSTTKTLAQYGPLITVGA